MKISRKISLSFLLTASIIVGVTAPVLYNLFGDALKHSIYEHLKTTVQSRRHHIETLIRAYMHSAEALASSHSFMNLFNENEDYEKRVSEAAEKIKNVLDVHKDFFAVLIFDKNGKVIVSNFPEDIGKNKSTTECYAQGRNDTFFKDIYVFEPHDVFGISISSPVSVNGSFVGIVCSKISVMDKMYGILTDRTGLGETEEIYLIDSESRMVSPSRFMKTTFEKLKIDTEGTRAYFRDLEEYKNGKHPHFPDVYEGYRGVRVLGVHDHVFWANWGIIAEIDEEEVLGPLDVMKKILVAMSFIIILIAWLIGILVSKRITSPIRKLQSGVEIIGKGDLDYKIPVVSKDEVGKLSKSFNVMTGNLRKTTTSIGNLNREISERKKVEKVLAENRAQLKGILDGSPDLIAQIDTDMKVVWANRAALDLCPDVIGLSCYKAYGDGTGGPCQNCPCIKALETGNIETGTVCKSNLKGIKGETYWEDIGVPVKDETGKVVGVIYIARNITERKKTEVELKAAHKRIEDILGATNTGLDIIDEDHNIVYIDPEWKKKYGDPTGVKCHKYFMGLDKLCRGCGLDEAMRTKKMIVSEEKLPKEGNRSIQVTTIPFQDKNGKWLAAEINVDISERKKAEEETKRAIEIKSDFISMVSHELRTPLTAIREGVNIISDGVAGKLTGMQKKFINLTQRNVDRLSRLINDVLSFQKLESGKIVFEMAPADINSVAREVKKTMTAYASAKGLKFVINADKKISKFKFDKDKITQVVMNIVDNAVKFTEKGSITISTSLEDSKNVKVSVKDTGIGIKKNDIPKLFQRFEQLGRKDGKTGGSGLGLAICKDIVEKHDGRIWIESKIGKGTEFSFILPIR
ncbi:MAG: PAS domain-containing protein [Candidatus Omnitrophica bacterium]|nr:PAS domain-containing protein [Candidatus Omnitrophota bacterium]